MVLHSRRSILRNAAVGLTLVGAGCLGTTSTGGPSETPSAGGTVTNRTGTPASVATPPPEKTTESSTGSSTEPSTGTPTDAASPAAYPTVDERVDATPPGSPALDPGGSWPAYRFDAGNTGSNPDGEGLRDGTEYWRLDAGHAASVADGTLYNTTSRGRDHTVLAYRDPATARVEDTGRLVDYGVNEPPVVDGERVYVTTFVEVFCFDARQGEEVWRGPAMDGIQGRPTVHGDRVLVNTAGFKSVDPHVRAFDAASGDELWRYDTGGFSDSTPAVADGRAFVSCTSGLHAVDLATGAASFVLPDLAVRRSSPVVEDGTVFAVATDDEGDPEALVAVDASDGAEHWRVPTTTDSPPVVTGERVYAMTPDGLAALDGADGSVVSSTRATTRPVGLVGDVLYAAGNGTVSALDATDGLDLLWSVTTEEVQIYDTIGRAVYHVTPVDGAVYVSARDAFYGIGPADG